MQPQPYLPTHSIVFEGHFNIIAALREVWIPPKERLQFWSLRSKVQDLWVLEEPSTNVV